MRINLFLKSGLVFSLGFLLTGQAFAAHPQLLLDSTELTFIRAKVANKTDDWQRLKSHCDVLTTYAVQWPHATSGGSSKIRGYVVGSRQAPGIIYTGYYGSGFYNALVDLGTCYQALQPTDKRAAAKYLAQAHNIITAMAQPPLTLTRKSDGAVRYGHSIDAKGNDLLAGAPLSVFLSSRNRDASAGDVWTVSSAQGCTSLNGTWKVSGTSGNILSLTSTDGTPAPVLNANCTGHSVLPTAGLGYPTRFWVPALATAFDWFNDGLSDTEKNNILATINAWVKEIKLCGYGQVHPESNYFAGYFWGIVSGYIGTDGDDPTMTTWFTNEIDASFTATHALRDYHTLWLGGGGFGEGWQAYGYTATRNLMNATLAMKIHGTDWTQAPYNFTFVDDTLRYWMEFTTPTKLALDDNEYVYPIGAADKGVTEPVWIPLGHAAMFGATAQRFNSPCAAKFQSWYGAVYAKVRAAAGTIVPGWSTGAYNSQPNPVDKFLYYDPNASSSDWTTLPLMYRAWGGNYAVTRSDWTDKAVEVTLLGGPTIGNAGNGKTQFNTGAVAIQRGNDRLLVYGLGEAARSGDIINLPQFNRLHGERSTYGNKKNSIFWAGASGSETRNQGLSSRTPPPGHINTVTSWGSSIDRAEDVAAYTYWRANGLEANNAKSSIDGKYHQTSWTREIFFLRPKLVIVHDRTGVLNSGDDRAMFWTFGRNISRVTAQPGMTRYDASLRKTYRGTFTSVLPASPSTVSVVDHNNLHFLYRVEVRPAAMDHQNDNWLAVLDAADTARNVNAITSVTATNADAVQFNDANHTVVAFLQSSLPTLPTTIALPNTASVYVAGMPPNTTYKVTVSGPAVTITADDGTHQLTSSAAGVLGILHRSSVE
jgi:hypothetical protein